MLENVKKNQQQLTDWPKNKYFRVGGHKFTQVLEDDVKYSLLDGLRALTLVKWTAKTGVVHDLTNSVIGCLPADIDFSEHEKAGPNAHVDKFLRDYHHTKHAKPSLCVINAAAPAEPLLSLLAQLRMLDVEKSAVQPIPFFA